VYACIIIPFKQIPTDATVSYSYSTLAKFIVSDWEDKVNSGIGLSDRPSRLHMAGRPVRQSYAEVKYISQSGTMNLARSTLCSLYAVQFSLLAIRNFSSIIKTIRFFCFLINDIYKLECDVWSNKVEYTV
jgi:hypothetical protein